MRFNMGTCGMEELANENIGEEMGMDLRSVSAASEPHRGVSEIMFLSYSFRNDLRFQDVLFLSGKLVG